MKRIVLCISVFFFCLWNLYGQNDWTQKVNFPGTARSYDVAFSIGHYGFVGVGWCSGNNYYTDFYKYNTRTNSWSPIANYPGNGQYGCSACTIEGKGYVGLGWDLANFKDFWRYDTATNTWTQMATFPGKARYSSFPFVIGHKAYFVGGSQNGPPYFNDVWVYDAHQNTWTQLNNYPGGDVESYISFAIGNHGYAGDGYYNPGCYSTMYEYDTASDTWTTIAPIPAAYSVAGNPGIFCLGSRAYVVSGAECTNNGLRDGWMYDTVTKSWCEFSYLAGSNLSTGYGAAFAADNHGYICTGYDTNRVCLNGLWEYTPTSTFTVADTAKCGQDTVQFSGITNYFNPTSWSWSFPGGSPATSNLQNPSIIYSNSGTYRVTLIVTACGGTDTVSRTITLIGGGPNNINILAKTPICAGTADTLTALAVGPYLWNNGATTSSIIVNPLTTTTYSLQAGSGGCKGDTSAIIIVDPAFKPTIAGKDSICNGSQDILIATGGGSYLWSTGNTTASVTVAPNSRTTYKVQVTNGCKEDTSFTVTPLPLPSVTINAAKSTVCKGDSVALNATGTRSYSWSPSNGLSCTNCPNPMAAPGNTTTYTVIGTDSYGCSSTAKYTLAVVSLPSSVSISPSQNTVCEGFPVNLSANVIGDSGVFNWQPGNSSASVLTVIPSATTTYTVSYTNVCGTATDTVTIFVAQTPVTNFIADVTAGCAPLCIQFRDLTKVPNGRIAQWRWQFGNGDTLDEQNPIYCYPDTGSFSTSLTTVSNNGCSSTLKIVRMITVYSKPIASFTYAPQPVTILNPTVQFTDNSSDIYGIAFRWWSFGDGESLSPQTSIINPVYTYQDTGFYCPHLVVENNRGCIDTVTNCIFVSPLYTLYIPSAFSPNADGLNDVFAAKGTYIKSFEMYVFDRWGMQLFHSTDINKGWDGTLHGNGVISQADSYVYIITATDWNNTQHSYTGEVTLLK